MQVAPAATEPVANAIDAAPAVGAKLGAVQPADAVALGTGATTIAPGVVGNTSLNARLFSAAPFGLLSAKRNVVGTFNATGFVTKVLVRPGAASTSTLSSAAAPVVAGVVEVMVLVVLAYVPAAGATTWTVTVQLPFAARLPPLNATEAAPATGAKVAAPQPEVVAPGAAATTIAPGDVGSVSLNAMPDSVVALFGLVMKNLKVDGRFAAIGRVRNVFVMLAGAVATTVSPAVPATPLPPFVVVTVPVLLV